MGIRRRRAMAGQADKVDGRQSNGRDGALRRPREESRNGQPMTGVIHAMSLPAFVGEGG
jgi:hypothetical protein